ncbi:protein of unknown function [Burkholderia multivorans]
MQTDRYQNPHPHHVAHDYHIKPKIKLPLPHSTYSIYDRRNKYCVPPQAKKSICRI